MTEWINAFVIEIIASSSFLHQIRTEVQERETITVLVLYLEMLLLFISTNKMELLIFDLMWHVTMYPKYVYCTAVPVPIEYLNKRDKIQESEKMLF